MRYRILITNFMGIDLAVFQKRRRLIFPYWSTVLEQEPDITVQDFIEGIGKLYKEDIGVFHTYKFFMP